VRNASKRIKEATIGKKLKESILIVNRKEGRKETRQKDNVH
jgi:hypothetical protein